MTAHFNTPAEIEKYGSMIQGFSNLGKNLARALDELGFPENRIIEVAGEGHYNTLQDKKLGFIRYAKHVASPLRGLFGAFVLMHIPEMAFTRRLPAYLGELGFRFKVRSGAQEASWPLHEVSFDFLVRKLKQEKGRILLGKELRADGLTLPAGLPLTQIEDSKKWDNQNGQLNFSMIDAQGKAVKPLIAANIIWGSLGAKGMKSFGDNSPERNTFVFDGTDDDTTAEAKLIECLSTLKYSHNTDLMDRFNALVEQAAAKLRKEPEMLEAFLASEALCKIMARTKGIQETLDIIAKTMFRDKQWVFDGAAGGGGKAQAAADMLGLQLPEHIANKELLALIADASRAVDSYLTGIPEKILENLPRELPGFIVDNIVRQRSSPFDPCWLQEGGGNLILYPHTYTGGQERLGAEKSLAKIRLAMEQIGPAKAEKVGEEVARLLEGKMLASAGVLLERFSKAFDSTGKNYLPEDIILMDKAHAAMEHIRGRFNLQAAGPLCDDTQLADLGQIFLLPALKRNSRPGRRVKDKFFRFLNKSQRKQLGMMIAMIKAVKAAPGVLIRNYGACPDLDRLLLECREAPAPAGDRAPRGAAKPAPVPA